MVSKPKQSEEQRRETAERVQRQIRAFLARDREEAAKALSSREYAPDDTGE
jgi:hypothetical protein